MSAAEELESLAVKFAGEAIQLERQGSKGLAISRYQRAVEILLKLCSLYPNSPQNKVYSENAEAYQKRINQLRTNADVHPTQDSAVSESHFESLIVKDKPNVKWSDIANLREAKNSIQEAIIYPAKRPDLFPLGWPRGILFFGPPGCGKTLLAAAVATEIDAQFYCIDAASIMSKWLGDSEKNVSQLFNNARKVCEKGQPAIVFIDELDCLLGLRSEEVGGETRMRNQFLKEMDGLIDKSKKLHLYVIGATNKPWSLDNAFIRRFQKRVFVPLPDYEARLEMMKMYTGNLHADGNFNPNELAKLADGYSGSDIRDLFQSAQLKVVREFFENGSGADRPRPVSTEDFHEKMAERKPSVTQQMLRSYQMWFDQFKAL